MKKLLLRITALVLLLIAMKANAQALIPPVKFQEGYAKVAGTIRCDKPANGLTLMVVVKDPFKELPDFYSAKVQADGSFSLKIPMAINNPIASMMFKDDSTKYTPGSLIGLSQAKEIHLKAVLKDGNITLQTSGGINFTQEDRLGYPEAVFNFDTAEGKLSGVGKTYYDLPLKDYVTLQMDSILPRRIDYALKDIPLSPELKVFLINALRIHWVSGRMFFYKEDAKRRFNRDVQEPPLSYYSFLKDINLDPETALYETSYYPEFLKRFLNVVAFGISPIADQPVKAWIEDTRKKLENTIGARKQSFYDVLALYAYLKDYPSLSARQKQNIIRYYTNDKANMATALLHHYAQTDSINDSNRPNLHFNATPEVNDGKLLDTILSHYPGKPVLVDIWGTWCQPCIVAHKEMATIKEDLRKEGVVFVYIADTSSPEQQWREKAKEIGDEHYYLTKKQIGAIFSSFKENDHPYPFYLIFDKSHQLKQKFVGFPGSDIIKQTLIEK